MLPLDLSSQGQLSRDFLGMLARPACSNTVKSRHVYEAMGEEHQGSIIKLPSQIIVECSLSPHQMRVDSERD